MGLPSLFLTEIVLTTSMCVFSLSFFIFLFGGHGYFLFPILLVDSCNLCHSNKLESHRCNGAPQFPVPAPAPTLPGEFRGGEMVFARRGSPTKTHPLPGELFCRGSPGKYWLRENNWLRQKTPNQNQGTSPLDFSCIFYFPLLQDLILFLFQYNFPMEIQKHSLLFFYALLVFLE